jgi:hypothetical protein
MPGDPKACAENAKRCWALASETKNPALKESLIDLAQRWSRLAIDLQAVRELLEKWGPDSEQADRQSRGSAVQLLTKDQSVAPGHGFGNAISTYGRAEEALPINNFDAPPR